jgi:anti-sigma B factor antagonist
MSAAGVRVLATTIHRAEDQDTRIVLCRFSGPAADCLLVSGFSQLFDVADSLDEAKKRLRPNLVGNPADRLHPRGTAG